MAPIIELFRVLLLALIGAILSNAPAPEATAPVAPLAAAPLGEPGGSDLRFAAPASHPFVMSGGFDALPSTTRSIDHGRTSETLRTRARWGAESSERVEVQLEAVEAALAAERLDRVDRPVRVIFAEPCTEAAPTGSTGLRYLWLAGMLLCGLLP